MISFWTLEIHGSSYLRDCATSTTGRPRGDKLLVICTVMSTLFIWLGIVSLYWSILAACVVVELGSLKGRHPLLEDVKKKAVALGHVNFSTPPNDENYEVLIDDKTDRNMELCVGDGKLGYIDPSETIEWPKQYVTRALGC
ncbi:hypothetical protein C5167_000845 [Papaver somniferum]|uniref:Uncharacterized protein n=1 Tax=Papaver somniferum TaxID=3469 RepID=A0A4Y7KWG7_PAPSO|nr:hypothetical protein C5167_000845 [Papaver somniferum]